MNLMKMYDEKNVPHIANNPAICTPKIFFEKYKNGDKVVQTLIEDLQHVVSDVAWLKEAGRENDALCIDFLDALNDLSVSI